MRCQINRIGESHRPSCNFLALNDKKLKGSRKLSGAKCVDAEKFHNHRVDRRGPQVLHETVGVLSDRKCGAAVHAVGTAARKVALWRTRVASSSPEFVIVTLRFVDKTKYAMVSSGRV